MTYNPLTDDLLIAAVAAHERTRVSRKEDGTWELPHLLSGFDVHPRVAAALATDQIETHVLRLNAGAEVERVLLSLYLSGLLVGLFHGQVRQARELAERGTA